jgi:hypothetical protein
MQVGDEKLFIRAGGGKLYETYFLDSFAIKQQKFKRRREIEGI